jgi:hypothetical protein
MMLHSKLKRRERKYDKVANQICVDFWAAKPQILSKQNGPNTILLPPKL